MSNGLAYNAFSFLIGKFGFSSLYLFAKYLPYCPGTKILDLGCGPGTNTHLFQPEDYLGIDISNSYIEQAKRSYPEFEFVCKNVLELDEKFNESFDLIVLSGLLHHLSDELFVKLMEKSYAIIREGGRLFAIENCLHKKQSKIKQKLILLDRGRYVREVEHTHRLIKETKFTIRLNIEEDLLMIPYTHLIVSCQK